MTKAEQNLENHLNTVGYADGAATPERITSLLDRLNGRMATLALAEVEVSDDFEDIAA